jgi:hypothetical protein
MLGVVPPLLPYVFMAWCLAKHRNYGYEGIDDLARPKSYIAKGSELSQQSSKLRFFDLFRKE